jgi:hypothetical protein
MKNYMLRINMVNDMKWASLSLLHKLARTSVCSLTLAVVSVVLAAAPAAHAVSSSPCSYCGDDSQEGGEVCRGPVCGNGKVETGEACDNGTANNSDTVPNACRTNCQLARCGDKVVDSGEQCDGGDLCTVDCKNIPVNPCAGVKAYQQCGCSAGIVPGYHVVGGRINYFIYGTDKTTVCYSESCLRCNRSFDPDAEISLADGTVKCAKDLSAEDELLTPNGGKVGIREIVQSTEENPLYELKAGKHSVKVTHKHIVWTEDGYVQARNLKVGQKVKTVDGEILPLDSVEKLPVKLNQNAFGVVLDVDAESDDSYLMIGGGIVVGDFALEKKLGKDN